MACLQTKDAQSSRIFTANFYYFTNVLNQLCGENIKMKKNSPFHCRRFFQQGLLARRFGRKATINRNGQCFIMMLLATLKARITCSASKTIIITTRTIENAVTCRAEAVKFIFLSLLRPLTLMSGGHFYLLSATKSVLFNQTQALSSLNRRLSWTVSSIAANSSLAVLLLR